MNMPMPELSSSQDAREFLQSYAQAYPDDVLSISEEVDGNQGITGLIYTLERRQSYPLIACPDVFGISAHVYANVFASRQRVARFLGTTQTGLHAEYEQRAIDTRPLSWQETAPFMAGCRTGDDVDLDQVPMLTHFESDKAPYITSGIIIAEDPDTGVANLSYHRSMIHDKASLATSLHSRGHLWRMLHKYAERGEAMPVAMVVGGHPLFMLAASARTGYDVDEREIAGGLLGAGLEVTHSPIHGIGVPTWSEIVIEGTIDASRSVAEGPFGEFSGYSSDRSTNNLLSVDAIMLRPETVLVDVEGGNTADHLNLARIPREAEMAERLKARFPEVTAVHYPTSGTHFHCYVAVDSSREGAARQVMLGLLGFDPYVKTVIAVDHDIDITNDSEVLWALATHFQPAEDVMVISGLPGSPLDPSATAGGTTSRMGLDATRSPGFSGDRIVIREEAFARAQDLLAHVS